MANSEATKKTRRPTALKRHLQSLKKRALNRAFKAQVKGALRSAELQLQQGDTDSLKQAVSTVYSLLDKGVKRGVLQVNKASRLKARFAARADQKQPA